jgi:hypothetical protein
MHATQDLMLFEKACSCRLMAQLTLHSAKPTVPGISDSRLHAKVVDLKHKYIRERNATCDEPEELQEPYVTAHSSQTAASLSVPADAPRVQHLRLTSTIHSQKGYQDQQTDSGTGSVQQGCHLSWCLHP